METLILVHKKRRRVRVLGGPCRRLTICPAQRQCGRPRPGGGTSAWGQGAKRKQGPRKVGPTAVLILIVKFSTTWEHINHSNLTKIWLCKNIGEYEYMFCLIHFGFYYHPGKYACITINTLPPSQRACAHKKSFLPSTTLVKSPVIRTSSLLFFPWARESLWRCNAKMTYSHTMKNCQEDNTPPGTSFIADFLQSIGHTM